VRAADSTRGDVGAGAVGKRADNGLAGRGRAHDRAERGSAALDGAGTGHRADHAV
jgi:hypothetical protein